jgi:hypothetical protein
MPDHCHLLIWPSDLSNPSQILAQILAQIMQKLSERTANFILRTLRRNVAFPWCRRMLTLRVASNRASSRSPSCVAARRIRPEHLEREEAAREAKLHARQSCEARAGEPAGRLALVKLAVLSPGRLLDSGHGSDALNLPAVATTCKSMSSPPTAEWGGRQHVSHQTFSSRRLARHFGLEPLMFTSIYVEF